MSEKHGIVIIDRNMRDFMDKSSRRKSTENGPKRGWIGK
jgi:hypothetical protein